MRGKKDFPVTSSEIFPPAVSAIAMVKFRSEDRDISRSHSEILVWMPADQMTLKCVGLNLGLCGAFRSLLSPDAWPHLQWKRGISHSDVLLRPSEYSCLYCAVSQSPRFSRTFIKDVFNIMLQTTLIRTLEFTVIQRPKFPTHVQYFRHSPSVIGNLSPSWRYPPRGVSEYAQQDLT